MQRSPRLTNGPLSHGSARCVLLAAAILIASLCIAGLAGFSPALLARVTSQYGVEAKNRILNWQDLIYQERGQTENSILQSVNAFFNQLPYISDQQHWGRADYWATPVEFLATNGGDCEDYAIAKYFTLRELGVPDEKLRITYVKAGRSQWLSSPEAHMVLAYYPHPDSEPLILDSLNPAIEPASQRSDLQPVYSFNGTGLWVAKERGAGYTSLGNPGRINFWTDMNIRLQHERQLGESYTGDSYPEGQR